jgi:SulP family sulfate permease
VVPVLPDERFRHLVHQPDKDPCPQLAILDVLGDLYFGAVSHVEKAIGKHLAAHPGQRDLLLRMYSVDQCDYSGVHALESVVHSVRQRGGDVYLVRVRESVLDLFKTTGFLQHLGADHFLAEDEAVSHLFHKVLDPAICIYECDVRAFRECQNLPKQDYPAEIPLHTEIPAGSVAQVTALDLWQRVCGDRPPLVVDVREPREFERCHIPQARLMPLPQMLCEGQELPRDRCLVFVCRGGRRSTRAAYLAQEQGHPDVAVLQGGMVAWEATNLLAAVDRGGE